MGEVSTQVDRLIAVAYKPHETIRALMKEIVPEYCEPKRIERLDAGSTGTTGSHVATGSTAVSQENAEQ